MNAIKNTLTLLFATISAGALLVLLKPVLIRTYLDLAGNMEHLPDAGDDIPTYPLS